MQQADRDRTQFRILIHLGIYILTMCYEILTSQNTYPLVEVTGDLFIGNVLIILRERSVVDIMEE